MLRRKLARHLGGLPPASGADAECPWDPAEPRSAEVQAVPPPEALGEESKQARLERLRRWIGEVATRQAEQARARAEARRASAGERLETAAGALRRFVAHLPPDHAHGRVELARALGADRASVAGLALDPRFAEVDLSRALFLDTETTGLGGGTGVIPFLVGLAWFEDGALVVEQLLLEELDEEPSLLTRLRERVEASSCLVTYNGKSYDRPLLEARLVMNRLPPLPERPHLDLLHCSRRVYRPRLRTVRLVDMEARVLGFRRERDIDGAEIPALYWAYLRDGGEDRLEPVLEHNAHDVAALAAILAILAERYAELHREDDPRDQLARAKVGFRTSDLDRAERFAVAAAEGGGRPAVTAEAFELLARVRRRRGDLDGARAALESGLAQVEAPALASGLRLELAKLLEHQLRQPEAALVHASHTGFAEGELASAHRVSRLRARLERRRGLRVAPAIAAHPRPADENPIPHDIEHIEGILRISNGASNLSNEAPKTGAMKTQFPSCNPPVRVPSPRLEPPRHEPGSPGRRPIPSSPREVATQWGPRPESGVAPAPPVGLGQEAAVLAAARAWYREHVEKAYAEIRADGEIEVRAGSQDSDRALAERIEFGKEEQTAMWLLVPAPIEDVVFYRGERFFTAARHPVPPPEVALFRLNHEPEYAGQMLTSLLAFDRRDGALLAHLWTVD